MQLYQRVAQLQCPSCGSLTQTVGRRDLTTFHRCPQCSLEFDDLDSRRQDKPVDITRLGRETGTEAPPQPRRPAGPRIGEHESARCPHCGSSNLLDLPLDAAPHYWRKVCHDCGRHIKFNPGPWTLERALAFELPFGKHRGCKVGALARTGAGRSYLAWMATNVDGNPGTAARTALAQLLESPEHRSAGRRKK